MPAVGGVAETVMSVMVVICWTRIGVKMPDFRLFYLIALPISLVVTGFVFDASWRRNKARSTGGTQVVSSKWQLVTAVVICGAILAIGVALWMAFIWNNIILAHLLLGR